MSANLFDQTNGIGLDGLKPIRTRIPLCRQRLNTIRVWRQIMAINQGEVGLYLCIHNRSPCGIQYASTQIHLF